MYFESFAHVPVTEELLGHVWEGEPNPKLGGHMFGLGREGKTEFPQHWTRETVRLAIESVLAQPQAVHNYGHSVSCISQIGLVIVHVKLIRVKRKGRFLIQTAFPMSGEGVFQIRNGVSIPIPLDLSVLEA
jgi:hypothetical protein